MVRPFSPMRVPQRRGEQLRAQANQDDGPIYLTQTGVEKLQKELVRIQKTDLPQAIEDTRRTGENGDFSENAEYQEAKARMRRLHTRVAVIQDRLKRAVIITSTDEAIAQLGTRVTVRDDRGHDLVFELVGPHETHPLKGRLSYVSPLGKALVGKRAGETVLFESPSGQKTYTLLNVEPL